MKVNWRKQEQVRKGHWKFWMNQTIIFHRIMRLILPKKTTDINFTGKNFFYKTETFIVIAVVILFSEQNSVTKIQIIIYLHTIWVELQNVFIFKSNGLCFSGLVVNTLTRLLLILLLYWKRYWRVSMHNPVKLDLLWIFDVSWNPKAIFKILLVLYSLIWKHKITIHFCLRVTVLNQFSGENTSQLQISILW